jgi:hypothetical protein
MEYFTDVSRRETRRNDVSFHSPFRVINLPDRFILEKDNRTKLVPNGVGSTEDLLGNLVLTREHAPTSVIVPSSFSMHIHVKRSITTTVRISSTGPSLEPCPRCRTLISSCANIKSLPTHRDSDLSPEGDDEAAQNCVIKYLELNEPSFHSVAQRGEFLRAVLDDVNSYVLIESRGDVRFTGDSMLYIRLRRSGYSPSKCPAAALTNF